MKPKDAKPYARQNLVVEMNMLLGAGFYLGAKAIGITLSSLFVSFYEDR
jgi:hypothetical protein